MWAQIVPDARNSQYAADFKKTSIQTVRGLMRQRREKPRSLRPTLDLAPRSHGGAEGYRSQKAPQAPKPGRPRETPPGLGGRWEWPGQVRAVWTRPTTGQPLPVSHRRRKGSLGPARSPIFQRWKPELSCELPDF